MTNQSTITPKPHHHHHHPPQAEQPRKRKHQTSTTGTIALLHLPAQTSLSLNATPEQILHNEEPLIVIDRIVPSNGFHLLVVRAGGGCGNGVLLHNSAILMLYGDVRGGGELCESGSTAADWFLVRKYDTSTEEISSGTAMGLDDGLARDNLERSIRNYTRSTQGGGGGGGEDDGMNDVCSGFNPTRILTYDVFTSATTTARSTEITEIETTTMAAVDRPSRKRQSSDWFVYLTNFISHDVLNRHGLSGRGDKVMPGTYHDDQHDQYNNNSSSEKHNEGNDNDGITLTYPPIPCIDQRFSRQFHKHAGTRRFLAGLSPSERTNLFMHRAAATTDDGESTDESGNALQQPQDIVFCRVLDGCYGGRWELLFGEWQLSFILFVCMGCLSSLEHWRDTLTMLSLVNTSTIKLHLRLFDHLLTSLDHQLSHFDGGHLLDDLDYSRDNFLLPALRTLSSTLSQIDQDGDDGRYRLATRTDELLRRVSPLTDDDDDDDDDVRNIDNDEDASNIDDEDRIATASAKGKEGQNPRVDNDNTTETMMIIDKDEDEEDDDDDDEEGPVIVPFTEVEASLNRSGHYQPQQQQQRRQQQQQQPSSIAAPTSSASSSSSSHSTKELRELYGERYPLLFATSTIVEGREDVLMACARILDEKLDVGSVREAAAYLNEVEAARR